MEKRKNITVSITEDGYWDLCKMAAMEGLDVSEMAERLIKEVSVQPEEDHHWPENFLQYTIENHMMEEVRNDWMRIQEAETKIQRWEETIRTGMIHENDRFPSYPWNKEYSNHEEFVADYKERIQWEKEELQACKESLENCWERFLQETQVEHGTMEEETEKVYKWWRSRDNYWKSLQQKKRENRLQKHL